MNRQTLLNTSFNNVSTEEVLAWVEEQIPEKSSAGLVELNVDVVMKIENDEELRRMVEECGMSLIDGKPLMWITKMNGAPAKEKISGSDLMPKLCALAAEKGYSVFIFGGREEVAAKAKENLAAQFPGLDIDAYSPPFGFEKDEEQLEKINRMLSEKSPDILFMCLGCPKQEKWWLNNHEKFRAGVCLCAGASVDFAAGNMSRAPKWISDAGFEWFYRFLSEPKRLFKRYFIDDMQIIRLIFKYRKKGE